MILVIDNYDSFTYNLVDLLAVLGADVVVRRNDVVDADAAMALGPAGVVVSPGPCGPAQAGNAPAIVRRAADREIPVLGVCLGHQIIGHVFGATVARAPRPMHGKTTHVEHDSRGIFTNVPTPFDAGLYHSLAVMEETLPPELSVTARSAEGVVMGIRHRSLPVEGVQFHPESILTPDGETILANFLRLATHPTAGWRAVAARGRSVTRDERSLA
jgi:anthranilate synthase/aminodeoxychorismate synthase-like glutamine amidotransferase